ncbi:MAG TPA: hypothetical protein VMB73_00100 [Acetobacteraceae bacterium]|jgi:hypothetical protein|nr:hypothetical protein [Acetobacteraceae bacterium]
MAALVAAIHVFCSLHPMKTWVAAHETDASDLSVAGMTSAITRGRKIPMGRLQKVVVLALFLLGPASCVHEINNALQTGFGSGDQWAGPVAPTGPNCGHQTTGLMTLGSKEFSFDPFGSVIVIQGKVEKDHLEGSLTQAASGQKGITIQFVGTINHPASGPSVVQGTVKSGQCMWTVTLHRD